MALQWRWRLRPGVAVRRALEGVLAVAAVAWTFSVSVEIVRHGAKLHHLMELAPAIGVLSYLVWRYDLVGTPKR